MAQSGLFGFPTDVVVLNQRFDSGSGRWQKPVGLVGRHTVIVRTWGGGAGGDNSPVDGGGGGGFNQRAYDYTTFPASVGYNVGAGGAIVTDGGDSYVFGEGVDVAATGGKAAAGSYAGGKPGFRFGTSTIYTFDHPPYEGGLGGITGVALNDAMAIWGGGAGLIDVSSVAPQSVHAGRGSYFDGVTTYEATAPAGGGTFYGTGAGQPGRVQFIIVRGVIADLMGNVF